MTPHSRSPVAPELQSGRAGLVQRMLAAVVLGAALVGVPWLQLHLVGKPWPAAMPGWERIWFEARSFPPPDAFVIKSASIIVWLLWGCFILLLLANLIDVIRILRHEGHVVPAGWMQTLAATLIGTTVATTTTGTALAATPPGATAPLQPGTPPPEPTAPAGPPPHTTSGPQLDGEADESSDGAVYLESVQFGFDSDQIEEQASRLKAAVAETRDLIDRRRPVVVEGHTDHLGSRTYNLELSQRRARTVARLLEEVLPGADIRVVGRGESQPRQPETYVNGADNPVARAANRRATITLPIKPARQPQAPPPSSGATAHPDPIQGGGEPAGIEVPGGYVAGAFAAGVALTLALARLARARRRAHPSTRSATFADEPVAWPGGYRLQQAATQPTREHPNSDPGEDDAPAERPPAALPAGAKPAVRQPLLDDHGRLAIAAESDRLLYADLRSGFALRPAQSAPVDGVVRAALAAILLPVPGQSRNQVITTTDTARRLGLDPEQRLAHARCGLTITAGPLAECEAATIRAARQHDRSSSGRLVLIADAPAEPGDRARLAHILDSPAVLALLIGDWPHAGDLQTDGHLTLPAHNEAPATRGRAFTMSAADLTGLLATIATPAEAAADLDQPPSGPAPAASPSPAEPDLLTAPRPPAADEDTTEEPTPSSPGPRDETTPPSDDAPTVQAESPVLLAVLGTARVIVNGHEVTTGLRGSARRLLTHLVIAGPGGATTDALDELLSDGPHPARQARQAAISNARSILRRHVQAPHAPVILHTGGRYRLDTELIDADLWRFTRAVKAADHTEDPAEQTRLLRTAVDTYTGPLADDDQPALAEQLRRQAADAATRLAALTDDPEQALAHLETALGLDPENEPLHREIMICQARLGRLSAVQRTYQLLATHLAGLGATPEPATEALLSDLLQ